MLQQLVNRVQEVKEEECLKINVKKAESMVFTRGLERSVGVRLGLETKKSNK